MSVKYFVFGGLWTFLSFAAFGQDADTVATKNLDEIVVTGQYEPQSANLSTYKVRTISMEKIQARGAVRLQDVLNTELNIRFSQDLATGGSNISLQGLSGQNVKVLIDGVPMVGRQGTTNEININQINVNSIERVEIVEGPMSVVYGADAIAGVINIITNKNKEGKFDLTAKLHEETVGDEYGWKEGIHNQSINGGYGWKNMRVRGDFARNYFGGWQGDSTGHEKQWHPKTQYLASGLIGFANDTTNLYYRLDFLDENIYNPGAFVANQAVDENYYSTRIMQQVQGSHQFSARLQVTTAIALTNFSREKITSILNETTGVRNLAGSGLHDTTRFNGLTVRNTWQFKMNDKLSFQPGLDLNYETGKGGRIKEGTQAIGDYAFFLSAEWKALHNIQLRPGMRIVYNSVYQAPPVIPSLNTKIKLGNKHDVRLSYGFGFRAPSLRELYYDFVDASHQIIGNSNLKAESSHSFNGSWNWVLVDANSKKLTAVVGGFYNTVENMIGYGVKTGTTFTTFINIDRYKTKGLTWNNTFKTKNWDVAAGFAYTGRFNQLYESSNDLDEFTWSPEVTSTLSYKIPAQDFSLSLYFKYTGKTPFYEINSSTQTPNLATISDYSWADFTVQKGFLKHFVLNAGVRNIFDLKNVNNTSIISGVHSSGGSRPVGYGRSYFLSISYSLNKL